MKLSGIFLIVAVCFGCWEVTQADPYVTDWWKRGVATVKNFVVGYGPGLSHPDAAWRIEFDPEAGPKKSVDYQRHFGYRGERLVDYLGSGHSRPARMANRFPFSPRY